MKSLRIALCQTKFYVGDLEGNTKKIIDLYSSVDADLIIFPELALTGYNCMDLFLNRNFIAAAEKKLDEIVATTSNKAMILGAPRLADKAEGVLIAHNTALLIQNGEIKQQYNKFFLPNDGVFNEKRYFMPGDSYTTVVEINGYKIRLLVCEDLWHPNQALSDNVQCDVTISINASPFAISKSFRRRNTALSFINNYKQGPLVYLNSLGAQDHIVFDGGSFVMNENGEYIVPPAIFSDEVIVFDLLQNSKSSENITTEANPFELQDSELENIYHAIIMGMRDYAHCANASRFILGLSGGIDSVLVATLAVDAFGPSNVLCVAMPSEFSSQGSIDDSVELVKNLGCEMITIPISNIKNAFESELGPFIGVLDGLAGENIQPRIRSTVLMAIANKHNRLLLCTSNKSESAVGYSAIYGDMTGAIAPILDLYKTQVYALSNWRNSNIPSSIVSDNIIQRMNIIPQNAIDKEPSAELRPDQKDSDSLPEYDLLDRVLYDLIEKKLNSEAVSHKYQLEMEQVEWVERLIASSEFKRFQSPPGVKINDIMLSNDRRYPICKKTLFA